MCGLANSNKVIYRSQASLICIMTLVNGRWGKLTGVLKATAAWQQAADGLVVLSMMAFVRAASSAPACDEDLMIR